MLMTEMRTGYFYPNSTTCSMELYWHLCKAVVSNRGAADTFHIINFTAMMCLNQLRAIKCFLQKIAMMSNVKG
jgi:hypothetical protein